MRKNDKKKKSKYNDYDFHGIKLVEWFATPGINLWLKVLFYLLDWYIRHPKATCFISNKKICEDLCSCGCPCTEAGVEEAMRVLKTPEATTPEYYKNGKSKGKKIKDGVGLIKCLYPHLDDKKEVIYTEEGTNVLSKTEWVEIGNNPNKYIHRKIYLNYIRIHKYISVFTGEHHILKKLRAKSRLKKLILKRPMSYIKRLLPEFKRQMRESIHEKYNQPRHMFWGFILLYSSKYYNAKHKNFIPEFARNEVKEQNIEHWLDKLEVNLRGSPYYIDVDMDTGEIIEEKKPEASSIVRTFFKAIKTA